MTSVALCITDLNVGGAERCLVELATRLDRTRFTPVVYCLSPAPPARHETTLIPALVGRRGSRCLGARKASEFPRRSWPDWPGVLRRAETQIIQTFLFHANIVGRFAARRAGVPRVVCGIRVAQRHPAWRLWLDRMTQRMVDRYVCVSQSVADFSASTARLPADKLVVIPNGIDIVTVQRRATGRSGDLGISGRRLVTFVGRLDVQKGLAQLLKTRATGCRGCPIATCCWWARGRWKAALRRQCRDAGIAQRVHFAGWRADIPAILAASSLLVLTSAWEGMPNVVLEAMASGLPVVATQAEGVGELLGQPPRNSPFLTGWEDFSSMSYES